MRLTVTHYTATSAGGNGLAELRQSLANRESGLRRNDFEHCDLETWIGRVEGVENVALPAGCDGLDSRNNQLAWLGLQQDNMFEEVAAVADQLGAHRVGVVMGSSTSSIGRTEEAYRQFDAAQRMRPDLRQPNVHNLHSPGIFVARVTGLKGPAITISTACSSSAKVFATAARWIKHGVVDAVLVGGVDSLCLSTLYGFNSLELISSSPCRPFDQHRDGISIGEAAGYALLVREDLAPSPRLQLLGYGESSDAYHMSHPHPEGKGAIHSMSRALGRANLDPTEVGYVNLHGTASLANDKIEALALSDQFTNATLTSSTKGWTGHTLGAAGILESVIALDTLETGLLPGTLNCEQIDTQMQFPVMQENVEKDIRYSMTNSFGFGGNNASLVFGRHDV